MKMVAVGLTTRTYLIKFNFCSLKNINMKKAFLFLLSGILITVQLLAQEKMITRTGQATIFSHTAAEDITANNYEVTGVINLSSGDIGISLPVQSFRFEKTLMQEHFNSSQFMNSKQYPVIILKGVIDNFSNTSLSKNGKYEVTVTGNLTIKGTTKPISEKAIIEVNNGKAIVSTNFMVKDIGSYGVGKPKGSKKNNVADDIQITYKATYETGNE